jgi:probable rRNA maturation factor
VAADGVRVGVPRKDLAAAAAYVLRSEGVREAMLSVALVTAPAMARLNRRHLGHGGPTDVIAFALRPPAGSSRALRSAPCALIGDIYICPAVARANAAELGVSVRQELLRLVVHGTLHVLGWDHAGGSARVRSPMWQRQEGLLNAWDRRGARTARAARP